VSRDWGDNYMTREKKLNHAKMLEDIDSLVRNDFVFDMECKLYQAKTYTQKDAKEMAEVLSKVYAISHTIHCEACRLEKYLI
jgi:hypothetical protein